MGEEGAGRGSSAASPELERELNNFLVYYTMCKRYVVRTSYEVGVLRNNRYAVWVHLAVLPHLTTLLARSHFNNVWHSTSIHMNASIMIFMLSISPPNKHTTLGTPPFKMQCQRDGLMLSTTKTAPTRSHILGGRIVAEHLLPIF